MSGDAAAPPATDAPPDSKPQAEAPHSEVSAQPEITKQEDQRGDREEQKGGADSAAAPSGVFAGWGFDVNAVAGNIGGLFTAAPDDIAVDEVRAEKSAGGEGGEDIGATAAHLASAATVEFEHASKAAQETIGKAAEEIGKGWGSLNTFLDDMLAAKPDGEGGAEVTDINATFHGLFPDLEQDDEVVDHFRCTLLQKYRCYLNNSTPEKTYALRGRLYVSTLHIAMYVTDDGKDFGGKPFGISVPFKDVGKIQKGAKSMLRLVTKAQSSYVFADFESDSHFTGALSLLEHMAGAAGPPPQPPAEGEDSEKSAAETGG